MISHLKKTNLILFSILISFLIFIVSQISLPGLSKAQSPSQLTERYIRTGTGWDVFYIKNQNIIVAWNQKDSKQFIVLDQIDQGWREQRPTYYEIPGNNASECPTYAYKIDKTVHLFTQDDSSDSRECVRPTITSDGVGLKSSRVSFDNPGGYREITLIGVGEFNNLSELFNVKADTFTTELKNYLRERNYFSTPYGCPGIPEPARGTRGGLTAGSNAIYACPDSNGRINPATTGVVYQGIFQTMDPIKWNEIINNTVKAETDDEQRDYQDETCTDQLNPFGWVLCPIITLTESVYMFMADVVSNLLFVDEASYSSQNVNSSWRIFTNIANSLLILIGLVIIASQILGFEFISAYTIKKALPRLIIGAILIQLSWFLFTSLISISNALGTGLYSLLLTPFGFNGNGFVGLLDIFSKSGVPIDSSENLNNGLFNGVGLLITGAAVGAGAAASISALQGLWLLFVLFLIGVLISILVALFVIIARQGLIIILLVLSPVALALWILPGTNKYWKIWWDNFIKLLMLFPLIMLLFATGTIAAYILASSSGSNDYTYNLFALMAYFIPIFLIGSTFKLAGSGLQAISGISGKLGTKVRGSGMFGLRSRAKIMRENSPYALSKRMKETNLQKNLQNKYANQLMGQYGEGRLSRTMDRIDRSGRVKRLLTNNLRRNAGGRSQKDINRAMSSAVSIVASDKQQEYKDNMILIDNAIEQMALNDGVQPGDLYIEMEKYRSDILMGAYDKSTRPELQALLNMPDFKNLVYTKALQMKDGSEGVEEYVKDNAIYNKYRDFVTSNSEAVPVVAEKLPQAVKGATKFDFDDATSPGFSDAIKGYANLPKFNQEEVKRILKLDLSRNQNTDLIVAQLSGLADPNSSVSPQVLKDIQNHIGQGLDLVELRSRPNDRLEYDRVTQRFRIV